jgi:hypothetical protein
MILQAWVAIRVRHAQSGFYLHHQLSSLVIVGDSWLTFDGLETV